MADFDKAFAALALLEGKKNGGYACDPDDPGGETYAGIARRYHPTWGGWQTVDGAKAYSDFPATLDRPALRTALEGQVRDFYQWEFWAWLKCDGWPEQALANEVFEQAVNLGKAKAYANLQTALNALNNLQTRWPDVAVDGRPGGKTNEAVFAAWHGGKTRLVVLAVNVLQGAYYLQSRNEKFIAGWLDKRVAL